MPEQSLSPSTNQAAQPLAPYRHCVTFTLFSIGRREYEITPDRAEALGQVLAQDVPPKFVRITTDRGPIIINTSSISTIEPDVRKAEIVLDCMRWELNRTGDLAATDDILQAINHRLREADMPYSWHKPPLTRQEFDYFAGIVLAEEAKA